MGGQAEVGIHTHHPVLGLHLPDSLGVCGRPAASSSSRRRLEGMLGCEDIFSFLPRDSPQRSQRDLF